MIGNVYETNDSRRKRRIRVRKISHWAAWATPRAVCEVYDFKRKRYTGTTEIRSNRLNPHGGWRLVKMGKF